MTFVSAKTDFHRAKLESGRAVLAPMAGFSDAPFRLLCREFGAAWAVTEMVSSMGVVMNGKKSFEIGEPYEGEPDLVIQLFGSDPQIMAEAGQKLYEEFKPAALDINMGCPVPKIVKNGGGACLLQNPDAAHDLIQALNKAVPVPVSAGSRGGRRGLRRTARAHEGAGVHRTGGLGQNRGGASAPENSARRQR
jgi:tRNA-dihydrouridine synthase B